MCLVVSRGYFFVKTPFSIWKSSALPEVLCYLFRASFYPECGVVCIPYNAVFCTVLGVRVLFDSNHTFFRYSLLSFEVTRRTGYPKKVFFPHFPHIVSFSQPARNAHPTGDCIIYYNILNNIMQISFYVKFLTFYFKIHIFQFFLYFFSLIIIAHFCHYTIWYYFCKKSQSFYLHSWYNIKLIFQ